MNIFQSGLERLFRLKTIVLFILSVLILTSCATYYQKNLKFNNYFLQGELEKAEQVLAGDKKATKRKDHLIYFMNRGLVSSLKGSYEESNNFLEEAYKIADSYHQNFLNEGVSFLFNPSIIEYKGEDFELLFIHYYKALNYLKLGSPEKALVECKRMNIRLNIINDKYKSDKRYKRDAFIHNLMGIIYEANKDHNNAFIAYRNAVDIYKNEYATMFNLSVPVQLQKDLLRSAYKNGFIEDLRLFEKEFSIKHDATEQKEAEMIFFWHNGLGPVKSEWSINFNIVRGIGGNVLFTNSDLGLSFPFPISDEEYNESGLSRLEFIRVAFPKYLERQAVFSSGNLVVNNKTYSLEKAEDINAIAFKSLQDRFILELGKGLLRVGMKKAAEYKLRSENKEAGALLGIFNAVSEQADTRQWQTLPHSIYYARIPLSAGKQNVNFKMEDLTTHMNKSENLEIEVRKGETYFHTYHSVEVRQNFIY